MYVYLLFTVPTLEKGTGRRMTNTASPITLRSSRRGMPRASGRLEEIAAAEREAMEIDPSMEGSEGDTSTNFLENATDDSFGRTLMEHAKDQRRVNLALKSNGQIFRKARVGVRLGLTMENLCRSNGGHEALDMAMHDEGKGSVNSDRSEPPITIPRGWGRKGTGGKDWLSRINSNSGRGRLTGDSPKVGKDKDPITPKIDEVQTTEGDADWTSAAAEVSLPPVGDGSSPHTSVSRTSTPTSTPRRNTSLDRIRQWEMTEDDFTGRSLQISNSPPISIKNTTLDRIREREIETLERRAVTKSRLGELREKTSKEQLRRRSVSAPVDEQHRPREGTRDQHETRVSTSPTDHNNNRPTIPEEEGEQVPNTPVTIYRGTKKGSERSSDGSPSDDDHRQNDGRPRHQREDSHGLLRQLARVSSASASPSKSALASMVDEAKRGVLQCDDESPLGDDTIRSLEDLLADDTDVCTLLQLDDDDDDDKSLQFQTSASGKPLTRNERERQTELLALERMNGRLKSLGLSIHDAKRGISKLAQKVCNEGGEFHDFIWPCEKCGCPGGRNDARLGTWRVTDVGDGEGWQISIPVPRLWTWPKGDRRPKLTWLGLFTLLAWMWVITEYVICSMYCHPRYASSMVDYGVDITAPRAPFAAVTMFWRSPLGLIFKPFWYLLTFLVRVVARLLGYLDGFAGGGGGGGIGWGGGNAVPRQPVSRDARIPRPVWGPDLSMMDDEYI